MDRVYGEYGLASVKTTGKAMVIREVLVIGEGEMS